jgi:hypothetical protein
VVWKIVCMSICTLEYGGMDGCMYLNMYIGIWWYGRCIYVNMYIGIWWYGQLYVLICTLVSSGKDGCMYVNMYIC